MWLVQVMGVLSGSFASDSPPLRFLLQARLPGFAENHLLNVVSRAGRYEYKNSTMLTPLMRGSQ